MDVFPMLCLLRIDSTKILNKMFNESDIMVKTVYPNMLRPDNNCKPVSYGYTIFDNGLNIDYKYYLALQYKIKHECEIVFSWLCIFFNADVSKPLFNALIPVMNWVSPLIENREMSSDLYVQGLNVKNLKSVDAYIVSLLEERYMKNIGSRVLYYGFFSQNSVSTDELIKTLNGIV